MMKKRSYHHLNPLSMVKMKMKKKKFDFFILIWCFAFIYIYNDCLDLVFYYLWDLVFCLI